MNGAQELWGAESTPHVSIWCGFRKVCMTRVSIEVTHPEDGLYLPSAQHRGLGQPSLMRKGFILYSCLLTQRRLSWDSWRIHIQGWGSRKLGRPLRIDT